MNSFKKVVLFLIVKTNLFESLPELKKRLDNTTSVTKTSFRRVRNFILCINRAWPLFNSIPFFISWHVSPVLLKNHSFRLSAISVFLLVLCFEFDIIFIVYNICIIIGYTEPLRFCDFSKLFVKT